MTDCLIINTGIGNFEAIKNVLNHIGLSAKISKQNENFDEYKYIIIPGVGSFDNVMKHLKSHDDFFKLTTSSFINEKKILGICAGMQVLFDKSEEGTETGLGLIEGNVKKFDNKINRVPHMGWNKVYGSNFFEDLNNKRFYFAHSFYVNCDTKYIIGSTNYILEFPSMVKFNNILGIQFHPEKSSSNGINLLKKIIS